MLTPETIIETFVEEKIPYLFWDGVTIKADLSDILKVILNKLKDDKTKQGIEEILYKLVTVDHQRMDIVPLTEEYTDQILKLIGGKKE